MAAPRYRQKPDANQKDITDALEKVGAKVYDASRIGGGFPDLVVGYRQCLYLLELKTSAGKLNKNQQQFHAKWSGYIHVVRTVDEALTAVGALKSG